MFQFKHSIYLCEKEKLAAQAFGAEETLFLINGSTAA